jgi:hypothetical protein
LVTLARSQDWKLAIIFENTARKSPQQNSYAELAFKVIEAKTRAVMNAAQIPKSEKFKMWSEAALDSHSVGQSNTSNVEWSHQD